MKKFIIGLVIIVLAGTGIFFAINNFGAKKTEEAEEVVYPKEIVYTVSKIERLQELPDRLIPKSGNEFLVLTVTGQNFDQVVRKYNVFYLTFVDSNNKIYINSLNTNRDAITYGDLDPQATFTGTIVFEVPKNAHGNLVAYDENNKEIQKIQIK